MVAVGGGVFVCPSTPLGIKEGIGRVEGIDGIDKDGIVRLFWRDSVRWGFIWRVPLVNNVSPTNRVSRRLTIRIAKKITFFFISLDIPLLIYHNR